MEQLALIANLASGGLGELSEGVLSLELGQAGVLEMQNRSQGRFEESVPSSL